MRGCSNIKTLIIAFACPSQDRRRVVRLMSFKAFSIAVRKILTEANLNIMPLRVRTPHSAFEGGVSALLCRKKSILCEDFNKSFSLQQYSKEANVLFFYDTV